MGLEELWVGLRDLLLILSSGESSLWVFLLRHLQLIEVPGAQERGLLVPVALRELCVVVVRSGQRCLLRRLAALGVALLACFWTLRALVSLK